MITRKIKIWSGLGTYVVAGTMAMGVPANAEAPDGSDRPALAETVQLAETAKPHTHPGQGGEQGGERGSAAEAPPDEAFMLRLMLIKGHLRVGRELVDQGRWNDALPHFLHPAEEIYKDLAPALAERKIAAFDKDFEALAALVKAKTGRARVVKDLEALGAKLDAAAASLPAETRQRPAFLLSVTERLLDTAAAEYKGALDKGRIANPVEYQDSRGFVWTAEDLVRSVAPTLKAKDADAFARLQAGFAALKRAWPSAVPGAGRAVPEAEVRANISRIVLAMSRLR